MRRWVCQRHILHRSRHQRLACRICQQVKCQPACSQHRIRRPLPVIGSRRQLTRIFRLSNHLGCHKAEPASCRRSQQPSLQCPPAMFPHSPLVARWSRPLTSANKPLSPFCQAYRNLLCSKQLPHKRPLHSLQHLAGSRGFQNSHGTPGTTLLRAILRWWPHHQLPTPAVVRRQRCQSLVVLEPPWFASPIRSFPPPAKSSCRRVSAATSVCSKLLTAKMLRQPSALAQCVMPSNGELFTPPDRSSRRRPSSQP